MPSVREDREFAEHILPLGSLLDEAIGWIRMNLNPEDVFSDDQLSAWAGENGFDEKAKP